MYYSTALFKNQVFCQQIFLLVRQNKVALRSRTNRGNLSGILPSADGNDPFALPIIIHYFIFRKAFDPVEGSA
jgi:hypothetical protein